MRFPSQTDTGPTLNAVLVALLISRGSRPVLLWSPVALWFSQGEWGQNPLPPCIHHILHPKYIIKCKNVSKNSKVEGLQVGIVC